MTKWQYLTVSEATNRELDEYGAQGWELVAVHGPAYIFKRVLVAEDVLSTEDRLRQELKGRYTL